MSFIALATEQFEACTSYYEHDLGGRCVRSWDRETGRGRVVELHGLQIEVLDATRESEGLKLGSPGDRVHLVFELDDVMSEWERQGRPGEGPVDTSWGARLFLVRDPDGVALAFLQWLRPRGSG